MTVSAYSTCAGTTECTFPEIKAITFHPTKCLGKDLGRDLGDGRLPFAGPQRRVPQKMQDGDSPLLQLHRVLRLQSPIPEGDHAPHNPLKRFASYLCLEFWPVHGLTGNKRPPILSRLCKRRFVYSRPSGSRRCLQPAPPPSPDRDPIRRHAQETALHPGMKRHAAEYLTQRDVQPVFLRAA